MSPQFPPGVRGNQNAASRCDGETFPQSLLRPPPRILIIEDDENDEILLRRAFDFTGQEIPMHFARDGAQAIDYLSGIGHYADRSRYPLPTLVLLDLKMPGLTGFDVLRWLRSQPALLRVPVVVLSGSMWPGDIDEAYRLGANSYLVKPAKRQDLIEIVQMASTYWFQMNFCSQKIEQRETFTAVKPVKRAEVSAEP
jgi:CheY-like chemotaxis protein